VLNCLRKKGLDSNKSKFFLGERGERKVLGEGNALESANHSKVRDGSSEGTEESSPGLSSSWSDKDLGPARGGQKQTI